jgi:hypothetical protein
MALLCMPAAQDRATADATLEEVLAEALDLKASEADERRANREQMKNDRAAEKARLEQETKMQGKQKKSLIDF